jgi:CheY-like chemotaxis protein
MFQLVNVDPRRHSMANRLCFPTVLVAKTDRDSRDLLTPALQAQGYIVLEARTGAEAFDYVRFHSRPIQVMLLDQSQEGRRLASAVHPYRPEMRLLFVASSVGAGDDSVSPEQALGQTGKLLGAAIGGEAGSSDGRAHDAPLKAAAGF